MSITLSVPLAVVQGARAYAESQGTSLNAMIRDLLARISSVDARKRNAAKAFREVSASVRGRRTFRAGYRFRRADAYDRDDGGVRVRNPFK